MPDCLPYPDMMVDMRPQIETVRADEARGPVILVFTDADGNWTMFALGDDLQACPLATGSSWKMIDHDTE